MRLLHWLAFAAAVLGVAISAFLLSPYNAHASTIYVPASPSGCGRVYKTGSVFSTVRDSLIGSNYYLGGQNFDTVSNNTYAIFRGFASFDFTSIPAGTKVTTAKFCSYGLYVNGTTGLYPIYLTTGVQNSTSTLTTSDFSKYGSDILGTYPSTVYTNRWNCLTLTNTSTLNFGGWQKVALRTNSDYSSTTPTGSNEYQANCADSQGNGRPYFEFDFQLTSPPPQTYYKNMATSTLVYAATQGARSGTQGFYVVFGIVAAAALFGCGYYMLWSRRS